MTPTHHPSALRWIVSIIGAIVLLLVVVIVGGFLMFVATPACDEPRNNATVAFVRMGLAVLGLGYGGLGYAVGRNGLRATGGSRYAWYAVLAPGTLLPIIAALAFRAPAIGDLFCF